MNFNLSPNNADKACQRNTEAVNSDISLPKYDKNNSSNDSKDSQNIKPFLALL